MCFTALEGFFIIWCSRVSYLGIWTRKGINKQIRNQTFIKQTVWLGYRFISAVCSAYMLGIILFQYFTLKIYRYQYPEIVDNLHKLH